MQAVSRAVPRDLERYQKAAVLAFARSSDNIGVKTLRDEFLGLLRRSYNFETQSYVLDASSPSNAIAQDLKDKFAEVAKGNRPPEINFGLAKNLLIIYYSGHSDARESAFGRVSSSFDFLIFSPSLIVIELSN